MLSPPARGRLRLRLSASAPGRRRYRGVSSLLAMLFLILFATLAVGFCTATMMSTQTAVNERSMQTSQSSAEAGVQFIRYYLNQMQVPPLTSQATLMDAVAQQLGAQLNGTTN